MGVVVFCLWEADLSPPAPALCTHWLAVALAFALRVHVGNMWRLASGVARSWRVIFFWKGDVLEFYNWWCLYIGDFVYCCPNYTSDMFCVAECFNFVLTPRGNCPKGTIKKNHRWCFILATDTCSFLQPRFGGHRLSHGLSWRVWACLRHERPWSPVCQVLSWAICVQLKCNIAWDDLD